MIQEERDRSTGIKVCIAFVMSLSQTSRVSSNFSMELQRRQGALMSARVSPLSMRDRALQRFINVMRDQLILDKFSVLPHHLFCPTKSHRNTNSDEKGIKVYDEVSSPNRSNGLHVAIENECMV